MVMKKIYETPELEIEQFLFTDSITVSSEGETGIGMPDGEVDPWDM